MKKIKAQVVILLTTNKTNIAVRRTVNKLVYVNKPENLNSGFQHLYIINDEESKEGEWFINNYGLWKHNGK